ncbi:PREDICTED: uncharacterized protein LOC106740877 isoform X2 [Dinoponera quadriceps]|uniref:Uncharacterized protein LOC106740877 isoform X2 n=1 Tax=Dinoponera quadriceps TaxID=609295 RepID=A0A6P3WPN9_DINQU|nr:PREDICTED: uncharacterized protein LOC106740877 isoform X2 [Dinoponera quadriceps]
MWKCCLLFLCIAGLSSAVLNPPDHRVSSSTNNQSVTVRQNEPVRRFACPIGFFRLKRFCYYLSAGTAPWREAHFHCKDRNATLAILDRNGKDRMLRRYLMGEQFTKLERWIGGIFNWQQKAWEWGVTGEKMVFQSFGKLEPGKSEKFAWHCIIMDPTLKYKWSAKSCVERKHYICEVSAGRIARRRKKSDPFAPQNQRLKPRKKGKKYSEEQGRLDGRKKSRANWRRNWMDQAENHQWAHGVKPGSRPPSSSHRMAQPRDRTRHRLNNRTRLQPSVPKVAQVLPRGREYGAFLGDGPNHHPQNLADTNQDFTQFHNKINDLAREEVLFKP